MDHKSICLSGSPKAMNKKNNTENTENTKMIGIKRVGSKITRTKAKTTEHIKSKRSSCSLAQEVAEACDYYHHHYVSRISE